MDLRSEILKTAHDVPETRKHLLPLLSKVAGRLTLSPGKVDEKMTVTLGKVKLQARSNGSFDTAMLSAGFYAKKTGRTMYLYSGNSYMNWVWRVSYKASDYLDPIGNTGDVVFSVSPELVVQRHEIQR